LNPSPSKSPNALPKTKEDGLRASVATTDPLTSYKLSLEISF
jgi:hypothetical protein